MGGLVVTPNHPAPRYDFEMLKKGSGSKDSPSLFLHFEVQVVYLLRVGLGVQVFLFHGEECINEFPLKYVATSATHRCRV